MCEYKTIDKQAEFTTVIEKSKFICRIAPIDNEQSAKKYLSDVVKAETGATHNCYAYILEGETSFKFSDDGEPHGTAGQPILDALKSEGLKCVIAVVTRYFGGIKLGTGGLSRAYYSSVKNCLSVAKIVGRKLCAIYELFTDYNSFSKLSSFFSKEQIKVLSTDYTDGVKVNFAVMKDFEDVILSELSSFFSGRLNISKIKSDYLSF
ncbi:MAG: YigZ family protein [Clostridia bacterium]|nr:YigZ family protein [Clostridia bacterium]